MAGTGLEAGRAFLEESKKKEGVITLPSGLQYKVLRAGDGVHFPTKDSPCECHYEGTLIDGSEFDSSYKRGTPTTFAPNQVIKGWTEAMQLMVEGDKWEMYIPMELAYGPNGKEPKIPAAAALIFRMEILKIKGDKVHSGRTVTYPEWTAEQLALWSDVDETKCQAWRESRAKSYADGNMRDKHPTQAGFDEWLDTQCASTKNKTIAVRVKKAAAPAAPAAPASPPKLTKDQARELLTKTLNTFKEPANKAKLEQLLKDCEGGDPAQAGMMKMMKMMPAVQDMMGGILGEYGFGSGDLMNVTMQIQAFGAEDPTIAADTAKLMKAVQGDLSDFM